VTTQIIKNARHHLNREQGTIIKDWGGRIPIALVYPNSYYLGMSNLGFQTIYALLNAYPDIVCERAFVSTQQDNSLTSIVSLESQRPLSDFAVIAFSVSYELDYVNIVAALRAAKIPLFARDRDESHPLIIGGGPCLSANPVPVSPFFDAIGIGEGEVLLPPLVDLLKNSPGKQKSEFLTVLANVPGMYLPHVQPPDQTVARQWARDLDAFATTSVILTPDTELANLYLIEVARGCARGCRFCLAGNLFRPFRSRSLEKLDVQIEEGLERCQRIGLVGAAVSDHPQLEELIEHLRSKGAGLSVSSLRFDALSEPLLADLAGGGARTLTLAPEAGSERLRKAVNKGLGENVLLRSVDQIARHGLRQLKLYFMVGLPGENQADIDDLVRLSLAIKERLDSAGEGARLILNVSPFIPKASTPFQRLPLASVKLLKKRINQINRSLKPNGIQVNGESPAWGQIQTVLARGDDRVGKALALLQHNTLAGWRSALEQAGVDIESACQSIPINQPTPWDFIDGGISDSAFHEELKKTASSLSISIDDLQAIAHKDGT
jgi:radical SAM superfamily enzyme YgiQ (UPF0313 family)